MSLGNISKSDAVTIRVITKKLRLNKTDIYQLERAKAQGVSGREALANVLGVSPGEDPAQFIAQRLTDREYSILSGIFDLAKDENPLHQD